MTKDELINVIKEYFDEQVNCGNISEAPNAAELAWYLIGKGVKVAPVKVGDKVYWIDIIDNVVQEYEVHEVEESIEDFTAYDANGERFDAFFSRIGETVFLSRETAEFELKITRKKKLIELRNYYLAEKEWDSLREIEELLKEEKA